SLGSASKVGEFVNLDSQRTPELGKTSGTKSVFAAFDPREAVFLVFRRAFRVCTYPTQLKSLVTASKVEAFVDLDSQRTPERRKTKNTASLGSASKVGEFVNLDSQRTPELGKTSGTKSVFAAFDPREAVVLVFRGAFRVCTYPTQLMSLVSTSKVEAFVDLDSQRTPELGKTSGTKGVFAAFDPRERLTPVSSVFGFSNVLSECARTPHSSRHWAAHRKSKNSWTLTANAHPNSKKLLARRVVLGSAWKVDEFVNLDSQRTPELGKTSGTKSVFAAFDPREAVFLVTCFQSVHVTHTAQVTCQYIES
ncbi:hypothetical protein AaE_007536, partial [Aphanomyces astaci]